MAALRAALEDSVAGCGRLVLLAGEAGMGKTRTAEEFARIARAQGGRVLWGRCYEGEGAPAFWPWVQALRAALKPLDAGALRAALGSDAVELAHLVPEIREQIADLPSVEPSDSPQARFRQFETVARFFSKLAHRGPLIVVLDDLQGADPPSLLLLEFMARVLRDMPVLILGTHRNVGVRVEGGLSETLVDLTREPTTERVVLAGLSAAEIAQLVQASAGVKPTAALVALLHQRTEGNPLFVQEFVRVLAAEGRLRGDQQVAAIGLPQNVEAVIERRLSPLSAACREVLDVAAVIGREFGLHVVVSVLQMGDAFTGDVSALEVAALDGLAEAEAAGLITKLPGSARRHRFAHALFMETLFNGCGDRRRANLHRHVGEALERLPDDGALLSQLAYHFLEAGRACEDKAIAYAQRAADRAMHLLAYEEAVRLYQLALAVLGRAPTPDEARQCAVLVELGVAQNALGDVEASKTTLLRAAALARRLGLRSELARAGLHFGSKLPWGEGPTADPARLELIDSALALWTGTDTTTEAALLARLALTLHFSPHHERREEASRRALAMARQLGDPATLLSALNARHTTGYRAGTCDERVAIAAEMIEIAERAGDQEMAFQAQTWRFDNCIETADRAGADVALAARERLAEELRQPYCLWTNTVARASLWIAEGRFGEAEREAQAALVLGRNLNFASELVFDLQLTQFRLTQWTGDNLRPLASRLSAYASAYAALPMLATTVAYFATMLDDRELACQYYEPFAAAQFDLPDDQNWLLSMSHLAATCVWLDDPPRAALLYDRLAPYDLRMSATAGASLAIGPVALYLGQLAAMLGLSRESVQHFETALALSARMRWHPWRARTQYEYARMLLARSEAGDARRARTLLEEALAMARELDMALLIERVEALRGGQPVVDAAGSGVQPLRSRADPLLGKEWADSLSEPVGKEGGQRCVFRCEGDVWALTFAGATHRLKDTRGLQYLAQLFAHPSREFHVNEIATQSATPISSARVERELTTAVDLGDAGELLDGEATAQYQQRLVEVREELEETQANNDVGRQTRLREELEFLIAELASAGRGRRAASHAERARSAVGKRIRGALKQIGAVDPTLGRYLRATVRIGTFCSYTPDPRLRVECEV